MAKITKALWKNWCPGKYRNSVRPDSLVPAGTYSHFPLYSRFPSAILHLLTSSFTNTIARSSSHRRAVLPAIDSLQENRNDSRRNNIYMRAIWRHDEIIYEIKFAGIKAGILHCSWKKDKGKLSWNKRFISIGLPNVS